MPHNLTLNKIHHGDCLTLLKTLPDDSVDVVFADPPFNFKKNYAGYSDNKSPVEYLAWSNAWLRELVRVTKRTGAIFVHNVPKWLVHYAETLNHLATFKNWIVWDAPTNCYFHGLRPTHYGILCYAKHKDLFQLHKLRAPHLRDHATGFMRKQYGGAYATAHPFGPVLSNVWSDIRRVGTKEYKGTHPCQLPVSLLERIILLATEEGQTILDPFMGTGTTAVAALRLGRNFIGFEKSKEYIKVARRNINTRVYPSKLGNAWVSIHRGEVKTIRSTDWDTLEAYFKLPEHPNETRTTKLSLKDPALLCFSVQ